MRRPIHLDNPALNGPPTRRRRGRFSRHCIPIFENELYGWHTDEAAWPKGRDFAMFKKWFEIELHSVVEDLCDFRDL